MSPTESRALIKHRATATSRAEALIAIGVNVPVDQQSLILIEESAPTKFIFVQMRVV